MTSRNVITCAIAHETNVFSNIKTDLEEFEKRYLLLGEKAFDFFGGTKTPLGGFLDAAAKEGFELIPTVWASAAPSGLVLKETLDYLLKQLVNGIKAAEKVDGVLLHLHGAMVSEGADDADGYILQAVREVVGEGVPIVAELDLHANISSLMVEKADVLVVYDTYPHIDTYERGLEAGKILAKIMRKEMKPTTALKKPPMIPSAQKQRTDCHPMKEIMNLVHEIEKDERVINVSVAPGFPWSDVEKAGFGVLVTTNNDPKLAQEKATLLSDLAWRLRRDFLVDVIPVEDAVREAMEAEKAPVILADVSDNPGGGTPSDGTVILKKLFELGAKNVTIAAIADAEAVSKAIEAGVGNTTTMFIGGKTDNFHGKPVRVTGYVKVTSDGRFINKGPMRTGAETNLGRTVVLVCNGIEIILTERRVQPTDLEYYRHLGIEPTERKILVVKSSVHFRASHEPIAKKVIEVDTPGLLSPRLASFNFKKIRRPIFPLDPEMLGIVELKKAEEGDK